MVTRRQWLALPMAAAVDSCELMAVERWNRFAQTAERYLDLRKSGVHSLKERARMAEQFAEVMRDQCF